MSLREKKWHFQRDYIAVILLYLPEKKLIKMQILHSTFYKERIPRLISSMKNDYGLCVHRLNTMLSSEPDGASKELLRMWRRLKPLSVDFLLPFWNMVTQDLPMIDLVHAEFAVWSTMKNWKIEGMKQKDTTIESGVIRRMRFEQFSRIFEETHLCGRGFGLTRRVYKASVEVFLLRNNQRLACLGFDHNFKEISRYGPQVELIANLSPEDFKCERYRARRAAMQKN